MKVLVEPGAKRGTVALPRWVALSYVVNVNVNNKVLATVATREWFKVSPSSVVSDDVIVKFG